MIVKPLPQNAATPGQLKALRNIVAYRTGGLPSATHLELEGLSLEAWYADHLNKHGLVEIESLEELDRRTASRLIQDLTK